MFSSIRIRRVLTSVVLVLPAVMAGLPARASTTDPVQLTTAQAQRIGALAGLALYHLARAQEAQRGGAMPRLADETLQLASLLDQVTVEEPTGAFQAVLRYARADLQRKNNDQVVTDLLPLYRTLDALGTTAAIAEARTQLDGVVLALERDERAKVPKDLDVLAASLEIPAIDAPLKAAREGIAGVLLALRKGAKPDPTQLVAVEHNLQQLLTGAIPPEE